MRKWGIQILNNNSKYVDLLQIRLFKCCLRSQATYKQEINQQYTEYSKHASSN